MPDTFQPDGSAHIDFEDIEGKALIRVYPFKDFESYKIKQIYKNIIVDVKNI